MKLSEKYWIITNEGIPIETRTILNEYLLSIKLANKAETTILRYRSILERFFLECLIPISELTSEDVLKWLQAYSVGKRERTLDQVISTLSSFFNFCLLEDYLDTVVIKQRWRPKIPQSLPKYLNEQEYARVKRTAESLSTRDRALVLLLFSSGCRRFEVAQLTIQDVDFNRRTVIVKGKGKKIRHVHFSEECAFVLKDYLQTRSVDPTEPLFLNKFGQPLQQSAIYAVIKKVGRKAGLKQSLHPHVCRHTFATNMLAKGADLEFIADEMWYSNLNTTRVYARIPAEDMILAYQNIMG